MNQTPAESTDFGLKLVGSLPRFPARPGSDWSESRPLPDFVHKQLVFNRFRHPGEVHVYSAHCRAGDRLRIQSLMPMLASGGAANVAFAVVAQSLPYSADGKQLPLELPAGFSTVVAPALEKLSPPLRDALTWSEVYPGPVIDTHTLVGGRCYIVVWNPRNSLGKYVLQVGHRWSLGWTYWLQLPWFWWQIRGWFGLGRQIAYAVLAVLLVLLFLLVRGGGKAAPRQ